MLIRVVDFESVGNEPPDCEVVEVGWTDIFNGRVLAPQSLLLRHTREIDCETQAVHHLRERDFVWAVSQEEGFAALETFDPVYADLLGDVLPVYAAHGAKFEKACWPGQAPGRWICTHKCGMRLWPEAPRHSNQVLRYFLGLDLPEELAMPPHCAGPDSYVTAHILSRMLERASVDELVEWSGQPALLPRCTIGQYRGSDWRDVDTGFLRWILSKDFDEDMMFTARTELDRRHSPSRRLETADDGVPF
jgi:exodeoxyribonuclease X